MPGGAMMNSKPIKVDEQLEYLKLRFMGEQYRALADEAAKNSWSHQQYFECLIKGETDLRPRTMVLNAGLQWHVFRS
jgi:hypothetical protein